MKSNIFFLKDGPVGWIENLAKIENDYNFKFFHKNINYNKSQKRLFRILLVHQNYIKLAYKAVKNVKDGDLIVCWLDLIGFYTHIILFLFGKKNKILVLNLMINSDGSFISNLKKYLFRNFLACNRNYFTLTSEHLKNLYFGYFSSVNQCNFFILNDCYEDLYYLVNKDKKTLNNNSVFCGGRNSRDWELAFKIARINPSIEFIFVVPNKNVIPSYENINVKVFVNVSKSKFNFLLESCSVVILPLKTDAPAGLIVLYLAGLMKKALVISDSLSVRNYIVNDQNGLIISDPESYNFSKAIRKLLYDKNYKERLSNSLHETVISKGSPKSFYKSLIKIIDSII